MRRRDSESVVYVLRAGPYAKVGTTTNLASRLKAIAGTCPYEPVVYYSAPGNYFDERALMSVLHKHWMRSEWFAFNAEFATILERETADGLDALRERLYGEFAAESDEREAEYQAAVQFGWHISRTPGTRYAKFPLPPARSAVARRKASGTR